MASRKITYNAAVVVEVIRQNIDDLAVVIGTNRNGVGRARHNDRRKDEGRWIRPQPSKESSD